MRAARRTLGSAAVHIASAATALVRPVVVWGEEDSEDGADHQTTSRHPSGAYRNAWGPALHPNRSALMVGVTFPM